MDEIIYTLRSFLIVTITIVLCTFPLFNCLLHPVVYVEQDYQMLIKIEVFIMENYSNITPN